MNSILQKLKGNTFYSVAVQALVVPLPLAIKLLLTGSIGPTTEFYFIALWLPMVALVFAYLRGIESFFSTLATLATAVALIAYQFPKHPVMNFQRQFVQEGALLIAGAVVLSLLGSLFPEPKSSDRMQAE